MKWDAGKLGFCLKGWWLIASAASCPSQSGPFSFTYSLARLQLCVSKVLSTEWVPKYVGLFGEQSLRKEPVCVNFFFFFNMASL